VTLWTDSTYVLKGITEWIHGWKKRGWKKSDKKPVINKDLWQQLDALNAERDISWKWVKAPIRTKRLSPLGLPDILPYVNLGRA